MGYANFLTTEDKRALVNHFGEEYLMEIFHKETKNWWKEKPEHDRELIIFLKKMTPEMIEKGVGGIISRGVEAMAKKRNIHPRVMMEMMVATEKADDLKILFDELLDQA